MKAIIPTKVKDTLDIEKHLVIKNGVIEQTPQLLAFLTTTKELESQIKAAYSVLEAEMVKHNIRSIKGEWGSLTIAERTNYIVSGKLPRKFYKQVLDTTKLKAYATAMNKLPAGTEITTTKYLSKKVK